MSKGKHSAAVNRGLRSRIADLESALQRCERERLALRSEHDGLADKLAGYDDMHHPAIDAERQRADAAHNLAANATETEGQRWQALIDQGSPSLSRLIDAANSSNVLDEAGMEAFAELFGQDFGQALGGTRAHRRNTTNAAAIRKIRNPRVAAGDTR